jgi:predicted permease
VIGDFGVATRPMQDFGPGERRLMFGTPHFMSPEQAAGELDLDGRSDIFSLGVLGYVMLTGGFPYDGPSEAAIAAARARSARIPLHQAAPDAPAGLVQAIERCLATDPANRYQRAALFEADLRRGESAAAPARAGLLSPRKLKGATPTPRARRRAIAATTTLAAPPSSAGATRPEILPMLNELRRAFHSLRRTPVVSLAALICLALGLGATIAIFSAVNTALLRPLPFADPSRLVLVYRTTPFFNSGPFAPANFLDLRQQTRSLQQLAAVAPRVSVLEAKDGASQVTAFQVSGDLFPMLGVAALRGRTIVRDDERADQPDVVMLGEEIWRDRFGADPAVIGRSITLGGKSRTVVGIVPRGFRIPAGYQWLQSDLWVPLRFSPVEAARRRENSMMLLGRLNPGMTRQTADRELHGLMDAIVAANPELKGESLRAVPLKEESVRAVRTPLILLFAAVGFVLLIAAANVASLLLARGAERRREVAIRIAIGASRGTVVRGVLSESAVLAAGGTLLGLGLAWAGVRAIGRLAAAQLPQLGGLSIDGRALGFAVTAAGLVALICGVLPAWRASSADPQEALRAGGTRIGAGTAHHRFLRGLIVSEVALALVLLIGAGLVTRGFMALVGRSPGFDTGRMLTLFVNVNPDRYKDGGAVRGFLDPALTAVRAVPGVVDAGTISLIPYDNWGNNSNVRYEGRPAENPTRMPLVENRYVSPSFFATLGMKLLEGRLFLPADEASSGSPRVVVVNQALARRDFPGKDPIGKRFYVDDSTFATIVGVVADIRNFGPVAEPQPEMYWDVAQVSIDQPSFPLMIRLRTDDAGSMTHAVVSALRSVDPAAAINRVRPMRELVAGSVGQPRFYLILLGSFAGVALLLSMAGLYGLTSYAVATRTREIGIRTALGATPGATVGLMLREGLILVGAGLVLGGILAALVTRLLSGLLYGISPLDPLAWATVAATLAAVALLATLIPARRAARVDPLVAIRTE